MLAAILALLAAALGILLVTRADGDDLAQEPGAILLEAAASIGPHPFGSLTGTPVSITSTALPSTTVTVSGGEAGLYGGSSDARECDIEEQIRHLGHEPSIAAAFVHALDADPSLRWSGAAELSVEQIPAYLRGLTSVTLTRDTRVTDHRARAGRAIALQSILQAGTAVMVDAHGVPRLRCASGDPLTPPETMTTTPVYTGERWPGFDPSAVVAVDGTDAPISVFVLQDTSDDGTVERTPGHDGTDTVRPPVTTPDGRVLGAGDVQVTLTWTGACDLDLHVVEPSGIEIDYAEPTSPSGGELGADAQGVGQQVGTGATQFENVLWPTGRAPRGTSSAFVRSYSGGGCPYTLVVSTDGRRVGGSTGSLTEGRRSDAVTFTR